MRLVALAIIVAAGVAAAEPLRPATTHLGWQLDLDSFIQVDAVPWSQASTDQISPATGDPQNETSVAIRRAFLRVEGKRDELRAGLEFDGNSIGGPNARLLGAYVGWTPSPIVDVRAGLMLIPFGVATPTNARFRYFMEQPTYLRALFPGEYDGGVVARGAYELARWSVAAMNGAPTKDTQWKGKDPSSSFDLIARLGADVAAPHVWGRPRVTFGVSALAGKALHPGTPPTKDELVWVDSDQNGIVGPTELTVVPGRPGMPSQGFSHDAIGIDASVSWCLQWAGHGEAFFDGALSKNLDRAVYFADPIETSRDLRELGLQLGVVQHLSEHALAGIRYDRYDADRDAAEPAGVHLVGVKRVFQTWAFLAAAQWQTARLSLEYDQARNPLGISDSGMPTTRADDRVVVRVQAEL